MNKCGNCFFQPKSDVEKAKSLILSLDYEIGDEYLGKSKEELKIISEEIQKGQPYKFDMSEVSRVVDYARQVQAVPVRRLIVDGLRWLVPPIALLVAAFFLLKR